MNDVKAVSKTNPTKAINKPLPKPKVKPLNVDDIKLKTPKGSKLNSTPPMPGSVPEKILKVAKAEVGVQEKTGNNDGVPAKRYSAGRQEPWCANFVTWVHQKTGMPLPKGGSPSVQQMEDKMQAAGRWAAAKNHTPKPGDIIFFKTRVGSDGKKGRHVGIVESVKGGKVHTIEGNAKNKVAADRSYLLSDNRIAGYGWVN
jgi:cell wall-associated NlpC family hydrolase